METVLAVYIFMIGAVIGSFLNVVIHRYPREESVVFPPSRCPSCRARIHYYDNVPIFSYLLLLGRCRNCRAPISIRYPMVELANALFYLAIYLRCGVSVVGAIVAAVVSATIVLIFIDAEIQILPDVIDLPGVGAGILIGFLHGGQRHPVLMLAENARDSLIGAAAGAAIPLVILLTYRLIRKIEGMGLGDVKMMAMIGAVTGWQSLFAVLLLASTAGALVGVTIMLATRRSNMQFALPFGVFLGLAFLTVLFFNGELTELIPALRLIA
jgi:leader peptidase (prepilin peptidase)/N-methyltransferase